MFRAAASFFAWLVIANVYTPYIIAGIMHAL